MKRFLNMAWFAIALTACNSKDNPDSSTTARTADTPRDTNRSTVPVSEDEKHRLYTAALIAAGEPAADTKILQEVFRKIGIADSDDNFTDAYFPFISAHGEWTQKPETRQFAQEIDTHEKATEYLNRHLTR